MTAASAVSPSSHSLGPVTKHTGIRGARAPQTTGGRLGRGRGPGPLPRKENLSSAPTPGSAGGPEGHSPQPGGERQRVTAPSPGERDRGSQPLPQGEQEGQRATAPSPGRAGGPEGHSPQPGESRRARRSQPPAREQQERQGEASLLQRAKHPSPGDGPQSPTLHGACRGLPLLRHHRTEFRGAPLSLSKTLSKSWWFAPGKQN